MTLRNFVVATAIALACLATVRHAAAEGLETSQPDEYSNDFSLPVAATLPERHHPAADAHIAAAYPAEAEAAADEDDCIVASYPDDHPTRVASAPGSRP